MTQDERGKGKDDRHRAKDERISLPFGQSKDDGNKLNWRALAGYEGRCLIRDVRRDENNLRDKDLKCLLLSSAHANFEDYAMITSSSSDFGAHY